MNGYTGVNVAPLLFTVLLAAGPADPALLTRLGAADTRLETLYETAEYRVHSRFTSLDPHGAVVKSSEAETRMFTRADGAPWEEIVRFDEGGKDETAAHEKKREKQLAAGKWSRADEMPFKSVFAVAQQPRYRYTDLGAAGDGRERIGFEPIEPAQDAYIGEAEVDVAAGAVRAIHFHPSAYPMLVHRIDVDMQFDADTTAGWALSHADIDAEGGALWVKRHLHIATDIASYAATATVAAKPGEKPRVEDAEPDASPSESRNGAEPASH